MTNLLSCTDVVKRFGKKTVFNRLNFAVDGGAVALTGHNGAGKSTLLGILCGISPPDHGTIRIAGYDLRSQPIQAKKRMAFVPDEPVAYDFMSGFEYIMMIFTLQRLSPETLDLDLLRKFEIESALHQRFQDMSLGTQRKFMIVAALMCKPLVLLMDEPTNGLDFKARQALADSIKALGNAALVFFSTHDQSFIDAAGARTLPLHTLDTGVSATETR
jgi:heme-transporting ATPase